MRWMLLREEEEEEGEEGERGKRKSIRGRATVVGCCLSQVQAHANSICSHQDVTLGPRIIEEIGLLDAGS